MRDTFALGGGPYHFFARSSRSAAASSICSARSFFSLAFSSSSCFRRLASETSMPPYLAFQLYSVASETPCLRARSAVFAPASCSRSTPIICSSLNLARFICPSFTRPDSNSAWRKVAVAGQRHRDIEQAALLLQFGGRAGAKVGGNAAVYDVKDEDRLLLLALRGMDGRQDEIVLVEQRHAGLVAGGIGRIEGEIG